MAKALEEVASFLESAPNLVNLSSYDKLIIVSDSKGRYLESELKNITVENLIVEFESYSGKRSIQGLTYLNNLISNENSRCATGGHKTILLFWFFTCDITNKIGKLIYPRYQSSDELIENTRFVFDEIVSLNNNNQNISIGILEVPPIFTRTWNERHGDPHWIAIDDKTLNEQVVALNTRIKQVNTTLGFTSPKYFTDFVKLRKGRSRSLRQNLEVDLMLDGVHPLGLLARKWLYRAVMAAIRL